MSDTVFLSNIHFDPLVGLDRWHRRKPQPLVISVRLRGADLTPAAASDAVVDTLDYGVVYRAVEAAIPATSVAPVASNPRDPCASLDDLVKTVAAHLIELPALSPSSSAPKFSSLEIDARLPDVLLMAKGGVGIRINAGITAGIIDPSQDTTIRQPPLLKQREMRVDRLCVPCVVGVNPHERLEKQLVVVSFTLSADHAFDCTDDFGALFDPVTKHIETSSFRTVEALTGSIADSLLRMTDADGRGWDRVLVTVEKPHAYARMDSPGVQIARTSQTRGRLTG